MTPDELRESRARLGFTQTELAKALRLGKQGKRTVRSWELGERPISGPATVAIELMLREREKEG